MCPATNKAGCRLGLHAFSYISSIAAFRYVLYHSHSVSADQAVAVKFYPEFHDEEDEPPIAELFFFVMETLLLTICCSLPRLYPLGER